MTYSVLLVWLCMSLERESITRVLSTSSYQTYISPTVHTPPPKPSDPIKGMNDGKNPDLIKVKLNIGT